MDRFVKNYSVLRNGNLRVGQKMTIRVLIMNPKSEIAKKIDMIGCSHLTMDAAKSLNRVVFKEMERSVNEHLEEIQHCEDSNGKMVRTFYKNSEESKYLD